MPSPCWFPTEGCRTSFGKATGKSCEPGALPAPPRATVSSPTISSTARLQEALAVVENSAQHAMIERNAVNVKARLGKNARTAPARANIFRVRVRQKRREKKRRARCRGDLVVGEGSRAPGSIR